MSQQPNAQLLVWTLESNDMSPYDQLTSRPYRRIVAIETDDGTITLCRSIGHTATQDCVVQAEYISLATEQQRDRVVEFFRRFIAQNDTQQPYDTAASPANERPEGNYNCYSAAEVIAGNGDCLDWQTALKRGDEVASRYTVATAPLAAGQRGFLMDMRDPWKPDPIHAFIGLGADRWECLAVLCIAGPLGIMPYDDMLNEYKRHKPMLVIAATDLAG